MLTVKKTPESLQELIIELESKLRKREEATDDLQISIVEDGIIDFLAKNTEHFHAFMDKFNDFLEISKFTPLQNFYFTRRINSFSSKRQTEALNQKPLETVNVVEQQVSSLMGLNPEDCARWTITQAEKDLASLKSNEIVPEHLKIYLLNRYFSQQGIIFNIEVCAKFKYAISLKYPNEQQVDTMDYSTQLDVVFKYFCNYYNFPMGHPNVVIRVSRLSYDEINKIFENDR